MPSWTARLGWVVIWSICASLCSVPARTDFQSFCFAEQQVPQRMVL